MPRAKGGSIPPPRVIIHPGHGGSIVTLNDNDVLSGRGGRINNHPGNIMFRTVVENYKHEYLDPRTRKLEKAHVAARLVSQIRSTNPPGRFLREEPGNPGMFIEIGDQKAWKKAGQALREDAPDVRKELDEETETKQTHINDLTKNHPNQLPQQQPAYQQQQHPPGVPGGIPPSVSYSPTTGQMPLAPPAPAAGGGARPDPPEAPGVTGYRTQPLRYFESGRGGRGQPGPHPGRGRGPPPPHQQYHPHPQQGYHQPPNPAYYGHPPGQPYQPPGTQYQQHPPGPHQYQQPYPHHPQQYPPHGHPGQPHSNGIKPGPQPQFTAPAPQDRGRNKTSAPSPFEAVTAGVQQTMDAVSGVADKMTNKIKTYQPLSYHHPPATVSGQTQDFPLSTSVATDFTMSDVSAFGESSRTNPPGPIRGGGTGKAGAHNKSTGTTSSSSKSRQNSESFNMSGLSDIMASNQSFLPLAHSGRTRSFPDLMLSTGDLLKPLPEPGIEESNNTEQKEERSSSGRVLKMPFHRQSSSASQSDQSMHSLTMRGFHPVRGRNNTAVSGINDAMSIMSLDSRKSAKSESSSWLENFRSMQSINSDMNPWRSASGLVLGDEGSVKSFLSEDSALNALDLAGSLLPPLLDDLDGSGDFLMRPDP